MNVEKALVLCKRMKDYADWMQKEGRYLEKNVREIEDELVRGIKKNK